MASLPWISMLLLLQGSHSYVLLTASLDDVHSIAKQIADSPLSGKLNKILRRATGIFNQQLRSGNDGYEHSRRTNPQETESSSYLQDNSIEGGSEDQAHDSNVQRYHGFRRYEGTKNAENRSKDEEQEPNKVKREDNSSHEETARNPEETARNPEETARNPEETARNPEDARKDQSDESTDKLEVQKHEKHASQDVRRKTDDVVALGKDASYYLNSMKKIMENA